MTNVTHNFSMYLFIFLTLYMFRAHRAHHQEEQIVSIQPLVAVTVPVAVSCAGRKFHFRSGHRQLTVVVLTQFVPPDDEHDVFETCRELKI